MSILFPRFERASGLESRLRMLEDSRQRKVCVRRGTRDEAVWHRFGETVTRIIPTDFATTRHQNLKDFWNNTVPLQRETRLCGHRGLARMEARGVGTPNYIIYVSQGIVHRLSRERFLDPQRRESSSGPDMRLSTTNTRSELYERTRDRRLYVSAQVIGTRIRESSAIAQDAVR